MSRRRPTGRGICQCTAREAYYPVDVIDRSIGKHADTGAQSQPIEIHVPTPVMRCKNCDGIVPSPEQEEIAELRKHVAKLTKLVARELLEPVRRNGVIPKGGRGLARVTLNRQEAAEALGISVDSFERYVQPDVKVIRRSKLRLFLRSELAKWAEANAEAPMAEQVAGRR